MTATWGEIARARWTELVAEMERDGGPCACPQASAALEVASAAISTLRLHQYIRPLDTYKGWTAEELDTWLMKIAGMK